MCDLENIGTKYEVTKDADDWKYVERILPPLTVPEPKRKDHYASDWKPQADNLQQMPYFVSRTKNHMIPVYLRISRNNTKRLTVVRKIQGDIWLLEKELRGFLRAESSRPLRSQVNELSNYICFNGDHVNAIKYWLSKQNF